MTLRAVLTEEILAAGGVGGESFGGFEFGEDFAAIGVGDGEEVLRAFGNFFGGMIAQRLLLRGGEDVGGNLGFLHGGEKAIDPIGASEEEIERVLANGWGGGVPVFD